MNAVLIYVAAATLGVQVGWQRLPEGGMEYIIQLDQASLDALRDGQPIQSDVLAKAGQIRSYRIQLGTGELKQETPPENEPWLPMTLMLLGLFASVGANIFLGWIVCGLRRRCKTAARGKSAVS